MTIGRKPIPTHLKIIKGNPGRRPIKEPVIKKKSGNKAQALPRLPPHTAKEVAVIWRRILKTAPPHVLQGIDADILYGFCLARSILDTAEKNYRNSPLLIKSPNGMPMQSPLLGIINTQLGQLSKLGSDLGFTPVARVRLGVETKFDDDDDKSEFFD